MRALVRATSNLLRLLLAPVWLLGRVLGRPRGPWLELRLTPRVGELPVPVRMWQRLAPMRRAVRITALEELRAAVDVARRDPSVQGLLVHVPHLHAGWAASAGLRASFSSLRSAGKQVVCYLPDGAGPKELYAALACDRIFLAPPASLMPLGLASRPLFLRRLLDRFGVTVQVQATGEYKSAADPLLRESMSEAAREQTGALLGTMHDALRDALASRPGLDGDAAAAVLARGLMGSKEAVDRGVVDGIAYEDELRALLGLRGQKPRLLALQRYAAFHGARFLSPVLSQSYVAVIEVRGTIVGGDAQLGRSQASLAHVVTALRKAASDARARAVVLHVSSPGGSAHASDLIHREVQKLAEKKPVVACLADVAASGGYYIAAGARRIVAEPVTVTGSIGVISLKLSIQGLLERVGVAADGMHTAPHADMFSALRPLDAEEEQMMQAHAQELYTRFLEVVAQGRGKSVEEVDRVARGRVWSGRDALAHGLVDVLGGFDVALDEARRLVPELTQAARSALKPRRVVVRGDEQLPPMQPDAAGLLEPLLTDELLPLLALLRREPALYYALGVAS